MFTTNSLVAMALLTVSLSARSVGVLQANITIGGAEEITLKCENGARFARPSASSVLIQAMGLGATISLSSARRNGATVGSTKRKSLLQSILMFRPSCGS